MCFRTLLIAKKRLLALKSLPFQSNGTYNDNEMVKIKKAIRKLVEKVIVSDTAHRIWTVVGIIGGLVGLFCLIAQTRSLHEQTRFVEEQTRILSEQYGATFRPYLAIENITTQSENGSSLSVLIDVKNYGQVPATNVSLEKVVIGGASIHYDTETGVYTFTYISDGTYVVPLVGQNYPPDLLFFPNREQLITVSVDKPTYDATVLETQVMHVGLLYSLGLDQYYYVAKATLQNDIWKVIEDRGN